MGLLLERDQKSPNRVYESLVGLLAAAQVVQDPAEVVENLARRLLKADDLFDDGVVAVLIQLEVLELDQHRSQSLGDAIMELPGQHATDFVLS